MNQEVEEVDSINNSIDEAKENNQATSRRLDVNTLLKRHKAKQIKDKKITTVIVVSALIIAIIVGITLVY